MAATHEKEKHLTREIARKVETALPETEVLAVELTKPDGFTVFIDDVRGVDHALCRRVTDLLPTTGANSRSRSPHRARAAAAHAAALPQRRRPPGRAAHRG